MLVKDILPSTIARSIDKIPIYPIIELISKYHDITEQYRERYQDNYKNMFEVSEFFHILDCIINSRNMQKTPLIQLIREELTRALVFGV